MPTCPQVGITVPKLKLPEFHGNKIEWLDFWPMFKIAVHASPTLSKVEKLTLLKNAMVGEKVKDKVSGLKLTEENYDHAIAEFKEEFGDICQMIA